MFGSFRTLFKKRGHFLCHQSMTYYSTWCWEIGCDFCQFLARLGCFFFGCKRLLSCRPSPQPWREEFSRLRSHEGSNQFMPKIVVLLILLEASWYDPWSIFWCHLLIIVFTVFQCISSTMEFFCTSLLIDISFVANFLFHQKVRNYRKSCTLWLISHFNGWQVNIK